MLKVKEMTLENFNKYGSFANMINPTSCKIGDEPVEFFRDMLQLGFGQNNTGSSCGNTLSFTQPSQITNGLQVTTGSVANITTSSASLEGTVQGSSLTNAYFEYGIDSDKGITDTINDLKNKVAIIETFEKRNATTEKTSEVETSILEEQSLINEN